jgi:hypothetical protein
MIAGMTESGRRWIALLGIAVVAVGAYTIAPAVGGGLFNAKKAKKLFYTKKQSNSRYAAKGSSYSKSQSDGRYPSAAGSFRVTEHAGGWDLISEGTGAASLSRNAAVTTISSGAGSDGIAAQLPLSVPQTVFGRALNVTGAEICFDTANNSAVTGLSILAQRDTAGDPAASSDTIAEYAPQFPDTGSTCQTLNPATQVAVNPADQLVAFATFDIAGTGDIGLTRVSLLLAP